MNKCVSCDKELLMVWPDTPWKCAFCKVDHPLCIGCYVEHTDSLHLERLYPFAREIREGLRKGIT